MRIFARFVDGELQEPVRVALVRVPAAALAAPKPLWRGPIDTQLLELAARELGLDEGPGELVIEYTTDQRGGHAGEGLHLHWIDYSWSMQSSIESSFESL